MVSIGVKGLGRVVAIASAVALALVAAPALPASAQPAGGWAGGWNGGPVTGGWNGSPVRPRPGLAPDPIEQSKALSMQGVPSAGPPPAIEYRLVPERRVLVPGSHREIVIPPYYERQLPDGSWTQPPITGYGTRGEGPIYIPEPRQAAP